MNAKILMRFAKLMIFVLTVLIVSCSKNALDVPISNKDSNLTLSVGDDYYIQYTGDINLNRTEKVYDLDLFEAPKWVVDSLKKKGKIVIAYINVGAYENWRPDAKDFPPEILGNEYKGWPGERWIDIRQIDKIAPIIRRRFDLAVEKGFDGIHPDNIDAFENETGFNITYEDQLRYNLWLSQEAHKRNLIIAQKNVPSMAKDLYKYYDFAILENCFIEGWCNTFALYYINNSKPVFAIEYFENNPNIESVCRYSKLSKIYFIFKSLDLDYKTATCTAFK
uniref:Endo alpha-1,4 polygalactosaminidase n=1 Tax=candidate division WOR-3 bacterium TaxID=2052148 RepID=A0A7V4E2H8_UNCW3